MTPHVNKFRRLDEMSFSHPGVRERRDSQRLLRGQIEIDSPNTLIKSVPDFVPKMVKQASSPYDIRTQSKTGESRIKLLTGALEPM